MEVEKSMGTGGELSGGFHGYGSREVGVRVGSCMTLDGRRAVVVDLTTKIDYEKSLRFLTTIFDYDF